MYTQESPRRKRFGNNEKKYRVKRTTFIAGPASNISSRSDDTRERRAFANIEEEGNGVARTGNAVAVIAAANALGWYTSPAGDDDNGIIQAPQKHTASRTDRARTANSNCRNVTIRAFDPGQADTSRTSESGSPLSIDVTRLIDSRWRTPRPFLRALTPARNNYRCFPAADSLSHDRRRIYLGRGWRVVVRGTYQPQDFRSERQKKKIYVNRPGPRKLVSTSLG